MKQLKKYCIGMLLLVTLLFVTACGSSNTEPDNVTGGTGTTGTDGTTADDAGTGVGGADNGSDLDSYLFDTDGDGVYDHSDVDQDGLLEEIGQDTDDVVDDLVNDVTGGEDTLGNGEGGAAGTDGNVAQ